MHFCWYHIYLIGPMIHYNKTMFALQMSCKLMFLYACELMIIWKAYL
jgi:hypothetical protein